MTREEAIDLIIKVFDTLEGECNIEYDWSKEHNARDMAIKALDQEPRWISVTEDAPPKGTICLWCNKQGSVFVSEITYRSESFSYVGKHGYFSNGLENYGDIVAWMPLLEPYKAETENT